MNEFIFPLRIYIEDTDFGGLVYHANYLKFFERARSEWAEASGFGIEWQFANKIFFVVRSASLEYLKPARVHEKVEVVSRFKSYKAASMIYEQYLRSSQTPDNILCKAEVKVVSVGQDMRTTPLPKALINFLGDAV